MLPTDPIMLLSVVNTKLRDRYDSLEALCEDMNVSPEMIEYALSRAPGIGKKTAQRIVLELKDKVEQQDVSAPGAAAPVSAPVGSAQQEAQAALQALGYTAAEAARAVNLVRDQATTVDQLIMLALRQMGSL